MAEKTTNYGLTKPRPEEFYNIDVQNANMDIIDAELKKRAVLGANGKVPEEQLPDTTYIPVTSEIPSDSDIWIDPNESAFEKGVDFWTEEDQESIVQQVITALGIPVFGRVDINNNIILTGKLAAGTYTFKYEDAGGKQTDIGTLDHNGVPEPTYTNVLPLAINSDGSQYVGTNGEDGYKADYRLGSSGTESADAGRFVTGFIKVTPDDTIYLKNVGWYFDSNATGKCYVHAYNANYAMATTYFLRDNNSNISDLVSNGSLVMDDNDNMVEIKIDNHVFGSGYGDIAYIRISAHYIGSDSIITINEPIE